MKNPMDADEAPRPGLTVFLLGCVTAFLLGFAGTLLWLCLS